MDVDAKENICYICLRTDRELRRIHQKFIKFHYTLCEITVDHVDAHYCYECEHLIKKLYKFKQRCLQSMKLLEEYNMKLQDTPLNKLYELLPQSNIDYSNINTNVVIKLEDVCSSGMSASVSDHDTAAQKPEEFIANNDVKVTIKMEPVDTEFDTIEEKRNIFNVLPVRNVTKNVLSYDPIIAKIEGSELNIEENNQLNDSNSKISNNTRGFEVCRYKYEFNIDKTDMKNITIESELDIKQKAVDVSEDSNEVINVKEENASENHNNIIQNEKSLEEPQCGISGAIFQKISNEAPTTAYHRYRNENVTATKKTLHACSQCDYITNRSDHLVIHSSRHSRRKLYACDKCDYRNIRKSLLTQHIRTHTKEKPFSCDQCNYKCSIKANLVRHLSTHTKEKPFTCDQCDYRSSLKFMLSQHIRTHKKEKPFKCDQCEYGSGFKFMLRRHITKVHTKEKPFACEQCDYRSHKKADLVRHVKRHTREKPSASD